MGHKKSIGLRGGPNEYITDISEFVSIEGYKKNSPDVNNPVNIIESSNITMVMQTMLLKCLWHKMV